MTAKEAKQIAVQFLGDCVNCSAAEGHESGIGSPWYELDAEVETANDSALVVTIGGRRIEFRAVTLRKPRARRVNAAKMRRLASTKRGV